MREILCVSVPVSRSTVVFASSVEHCKSSIAFYLHAAPSQSPLNVTLGNITAAAAHLIWSPPSLRHQNGLISGYTVLYSLEPPSGTGGGPSVREGTRVLTTVPEVYLCLLTPERSYVMSVSARTVAGEGPFSDPLSFHTPRSGASIYIPTNT